MINPIPEKGFPDAKLKPLPADTYLTMPSNVTSESPLSLDYRLIDKTQYYPLELHIAIEAWIHIFAYASLQSRVDNYKTYKQTAYHVC